MIKGLYETHLFVSDLEVSISFYKNVLGLQLCHYEKERKVAFFWIGKPKQSMLGLWDNSNKQIDKRHFAFQCDEAFIINESVAFLKSMGIKPYNFLNNGNETPMVFAWMPAVSIYFEDPDGHELEFIAILQGEPRSELGVISVEQWITPEYLG